MKITRGTFTSVGMISGRTGEIRLTRYWFVFFFRGRYIKIPYIDLASHEFLAGPTGIIWIAAIVANASFWFALIFF